MDNLGDIIRANSLTYTGAASVILLVLLVLSHFFKDKNAILRKILFWTIMIVISANTLYLVSATIFLNTKSKTGGPVHYHADYQIWNCGKEIEVMVPTGLSNKVGSPLIHTHNDKRIHAEGVILDPHELTVSHFFTELGGELESKELIVPTDEGIVDLKDSDLCPDGTPGILQIFVYKTMDKIFTQKKLENISEYQISPFTQVPPGDCVIIEFGPTKNVTDKICQSYQVAKEMGKIYGN